VTSWTWLRTGRLIDREEGEPGSKSEIVFLKISKLPLIWAALELVLKTQH
jgi:hypothetical protein